VRQARRRTSVQVYQPMRCAAGLSKEDVKSKLLIPVRRIQQGLQGFVLDFDTDRALHRGILGVSLSICLRGRSPKCGTQLRRPPRGLLPARPTATATATVGSAQSGQELALELGDGLPALLGAIFVRHRKPKLEL